MSKTTTPLQYDLFGEVEAAERAAAAADTAQRIHDGLTCIADAHRTALELLIGDRTPDCGEIKVSANGPWAYQILRDRFLFEDRSTWGGWYARPRRHLTWAEFDDATGSDPRLPAVRDWARSLTAPDAWRDLYRPYEMDTNPEGWHPDYIKGDHARPGWPERRQIWVTVLTILRDAAHQATRGGEQA